MGAFLLSCCSAVIDTVGEAEDERRRLMKRSKTEREYVTEGAKGEGKDNRRRGEKKGRNGGERQSSALMFE